MTYPDGSVYFLPDRFRPLGVFRLFSTQAFIDSASAQKRSGRKAIREKSFSLIFLPEKESTVLMEGMAATSMPSRGTQLNTHFG
jgi:hypothetical protein